MKILLATNNKAKIERFKRLLNHIDSNIEAFLPSELGIDSIDTEENGATLMDNALLKARAYFGKTNFPILSNDTGFYVEGDGFIDAPKRKAMEGQDENNLSEEEISSHLLNFWKALATQHGGRVDAAWVEAFAIIYPNGEVKKAESRREIILTNEEFGIPHPHFPMRALYISKSTNKPAILHSDEEVILEMEPAINALKELLSGRQV